MGGAGFEIWSIQDQIEFDNVYVGDVSFTSIYRLPCYNTLLHWHVYSFTVFLCLTPILLFL
jgi:hypothetical protein